MLDNSLLTMVAATARDDAGRVMGEVLVLHGAHPRLGVRGGTCPDAELPALGGVRVIGLPKEAGSLRATLHRVVPAARVDGAPRAVQSMLAHNVLPEHLMLVPVASKELPGGAAVYDSSEGALVVDAGDEPTACPEGWSLLWSLEPEMTSVQ